VKLLLAFFGLWVTPICRSGGLIILPEFGHQIPVSLINRFIKGGGARVNRYRFGFKQVSASVRWRGYDFSYYTDDWGGGQIEGDEQGLDDLFNAMSRSSRTKVRNIPD
tara:strand:- start:140 stop:463 length:324 start_codon:yes stop_codon:yes gene_type:complete